MTVKKTPKTHTHTYVVQLSSTLFQSGMRTFPWLQSESNSKSPHHVLLGFSPGFLKSFHTHSRKNSWCSSRHGWRSWLIVTLVLSSSFPSHPKSSSALSLHIRPTHSHYLFCYGATIPPPPTLRPNQCTAQWEHSPREIQPSTQAAHGNHLLAPSLLEADVAATVVDTRVARRDSHSSAKLAGQAGEGGRAVL